ncbi:thiol reductant ABC exporter subunit CydD [Propionibacteriaceae bacterium Y1685]|uniref:thiol reductant ABC exporter subunit CydD n=1 Tax=Microlunatus sp. Y1700 TaxID=3418487 RepID=UPI003B7D80A5
MPGPVDPRLLRRSAATRGYLVATVLVGLAQAGLIIGQAWLLASIVSGLWAGSGVDRQASSILGLAGVLGGRTVLAWLQPWLGHRAAAAVKSQLRKDILASRLRHPIDEVTSTGRLVALVGRGIDALDGWYAKYLPQLVLGVVVPLVVGVAVWRADVISAVTIALTLPLIPLFMVLIGQVTQHRMDKRWRVQSLLAHHFADLVAGLPTLQILGRARHQDRGLAVAETRHRRETLSTLRVAFLSSLALELLATLSVALVAVGIGLRVVDGELALITGLFVLVLAPEAYLPLRQVGVHYHDAADGMAAAREAFEIIDEEPHPQDHDLGSVSMITFDRAQVIDDTRARTAPLSATIHGGRITAIVGPSGSGKTTALTLLMGWQHPTAGRILLDGHELSEQTARAWRRQVAWVPQVPGLVPGTIADNVRLGAPRATEADVADALASCGASDLDPERSVGADGAALSVGERRRVALARARLRITVGGARWLLLDEPTAGLDADTEREVIAGLPDGIGVVVVTHRPAVRALADELIMIEPAPHDPAPTDCSPVPVRGALAPAEPSSAARFGVRTTAATSIVFGVLAAGSGIALLGTAGWLLSRAAQQPPVLHLLVAVTLVRAFGLGKGLFRYVERLTGHDAALRVQSALRIDTYRALSRRVLLGRRGHDVLSRVTSDVDAAQDDVVRVRLPIAVTAIVSVTMIIVASVFSLPYGILLAGCLVLAGIVAPVVGQRLAARTDVALATRRGALADVVGEIHELAPELSANDAVSDRLVRAAAADAELTAIDRQGARATGVAAGLQFLGVAVAVVGALLITGPAVAAGALDPNLVAVLALTPLALVEVLAVLPPAAQTATRSRTALARVRELDRAGAPLHRERTEDHSGSARVRLDELSIGWPGHDAVQTGIDLDLGPGDRMVLAGASGIGKTTLAATIAGLLAPMEGTVTVEGRVGLLSQDAYVFDTTVAENVRLGRIEARPEEIVEALHRVGLDLDPDRRVGEHGHALSGGEARRLAMARIVLARDEVIILDEPTEHLDADTAAALLRDIDELWPTSPMIVISHDPVHVADALDAKVWRLTPTHDRQSPRRSSHLAIQEPFASIM